ncbi:MAG: hypothetical protein A2126_01095 [Candidatus Woykebacteria bacterium GWB1_45_5]|uniref:Uncharacterized protein n=2 Tax=Candidatus Woykeibacteriota TaxID=1817899 RepID=A0A1G1W3A8_9BACT|nr:MAG: hypothetical protein A2113_02530 [Candidatus Woykebacteria bacterium GWA1_44_8]OGY22746.1 MAG: hypothetical protein A2126_01095 [Candidatus Woykebacteria bacterium GWB1_45_5]
MEDAPAPEGDIQPVEKGPEPAQPSEEEKEVPIGPRPEAEKPGEQPPFHSPQPPTKAREEAKEAGGDAAKTFFEEQQPTAPSQSPSKLPILATRKVQPFIQSARRHTAVRKALREEAT